MREEERRGKMEEGGRCRGRRKRKETGEGRRRKRERRERKKKGAKDEGKERRGV